MALVTSTGVIYATGGTEGRFHALAHLYYVPVVIAALAFGPVAGVFAGLGAALLGGPLMPANVSLHVAQPVDDWLTRAFFFVLIGGTVGGLTARLRSAFEAERRRRAQLDALHEIDRAILSNKNLDDVFDQIVESVEGLVEADICCLYLLDREAGRPTVQSRWVRSRNGCCGEPVDGAGFVEGLRHEMSTIVRLAESTHRAAVCVDLPRDTHLTESERCAFQQLGLRSAILAPLASGDQVVGGVLVGYTSPHRSCEDTKLDVERIAHQASIALKNVQQMEQLARFGQETVAAFSEAIERRDLNTGNHVQRIKGLATVVAQELGLTPEEVKLVKYAAQLHDVGKLAIPTHILRKRGSLSRQEWTIIKQHPAIGSQIIEQVSSLQGAAPLVRHHHERYDGTGYPAGLCGTDIPLGARIIAVVDAFDAMISDRPYRRGMLRRETIAELEAHAGTQFDPHIVAAFLRSAGATGGSNLAPEMVLGGRSSRNSSIPNMVNNNGQRHVDV